MKEKWVLVKGYSDYEVSNLGHVRSWHKPGPGGGRRDVPLVLLPGSTSKGYLYVVLHNDKGHKNFFVHRLVLQSFVGPCPLREESRHKDGDTSNNRIDNLLWGTRVENMSDQVRHGTRIAGRRHPNAIVVSQQVVKVVQKRQATGETITSIARSLGLSRPFIKSIVNKTHWQMRSS